MAEAAVSIVIERLAELLIQQTVRKIVFLKKLQGQVEKLKTLLINMRCFLKYADQNQDDDPRIRNWVSQIRLAAYDAEDVIETFVVKIDSSKKKKGLLKRLVYFPKQLLSYYKVENDIKSIQKRIREIEKSRETFGIQNLGEESRKRGEELLKLRESSPFTVDKDLIGLEEKTSSIVAQLLVEDKRLRVVSIVGMPGVGKTTLAREIYNHVRVSSHFGFRAWVYVSQNCNFKEILGEIIKQVETPTIDLIGMLEKMKKSDLERMLHKKLQDTRYLIVLDDIWEEEAWDILAGAFPDFGNGSRLLLTSRNESVAQRADSVSVPYRMKTLDQNESWQLFLQNAFGHGNRSFLSHLGSIGRKIVDRCDGLPLAITVIGSLLRGKSSESEWQRVLDTISTHWSSGRKGVSAILELSYNDLPWDLKPCFLYFAFFPEDYEIPTRKLFHLWVAEGLIQQRQSENLEDLAANNLDALINKSLVQGVALKADDTVKTCRVHDLLRELAITKAREAIFLEIHEFGESQPSDKCRHLSIHGCGRRDSFSGQSAPHLRSVLFFDQDQVVQVNIIDLTTLKLLRVLDLENSGSTCLPEEIGSLTLLRYLGLRNLRITKLPKSIGYLRSLQTLDIYTTKTTVEVPNVLWKLKDLRHLYMNLVKRTAPLKFENLRALQTLSFVRSSDLLHNNLMTLKSLRKLGVAVDDQSNMDELCSAIAKLGKLRSLCLQMDSRNPSLIGLSHLSHITNLKLVRPLDMPPNAHHFPPHLTHLSLMHTMLEKDPMPILEKLELLSVLKLRMAYCGRVLKTSRNGFLQLEVLELSRLYHLSTLDIGEGAMPNLRCLRIISCYELNVPSTRFKSMSALQKLEITGLGWPVSQIKCPHVRANSV